MGHFAKPGPEHEKLRKLSGAWTARIKYYPSPGEPPQESNGEFLARMDLGGFFLSRDVNYGMEGRFQGRGLTGYDPLRGAYVGTWVDSTSPFIYRTEGRFDDRGVYCETSEGPGPDGALVRTRMTTEVLGPNEMVFRMYRLHDGHADILVLQIEHTRRRFID